MKKTAQLLEVADLKAVGHYEDDLVLFIATEDPNIPTTLCVQADFSKYRFDAVKPLSDYLGMKTYQRIHDADRRISYRQRILEEMNPEVIFEMLQVFTEQRLNHQKQEDPKGWEPSWEHPYGI